MARIAKSGLEYFPFDIDFFQDVNIRKLIKRQGGKAVAVYAHLLCLIYKNGYYMQWDNELPFIVSEVLGFEEAYISEVIKSCLMLGLFDKNMYDSEQVLTSKGIQARYWNIQHNARRLNRIDRYSLLGNLQTPKPKKRPRQAKDDKQVKKSKPAATKPKTKAKATEPQPQASGSNSEWLKEFFADNHSENLQLLCKNFGLKPGDTARLRALADAVVAEWELSDTRHRDYSDWSRHLIATMRIKNGETARQDKQSKQPTPPKSDYSFKGGFGGQDV